MSTVDNEDGFLLPDGCFNPYAHAKNEMQGIASDDDPFGLRLGKVWRNNGTEGLNLAKISGNKQRADSGIHDEVALIRFRMAPNRKDGAIECVVTRDGVEVPAFYLDPNVFLSYLPVQAPRLLGKMTRFYSDHDRFCMNVQDDEPTGSGVKITVYNKNGTEDESKWTPAGQLIIPKL